MNHYPRSRRTGEEAAPLSLQIAGRPEPAVLFDSRPLLPRAGCDPHLLQPAEALAYIVDFSLNPVSTGSDGRPKCYPIRL